MSKLRVLFVDDEPNVLEGLRRMLRRQRDEWEMAFVENAQQALAHLATQPFDVVVTDMQMPEMSGAELLETLAIHYPQVVRIVLSGYPADQSTLRALRTTHQFLAKPADPDTLRQAIIGAAHVQRSIPVAGVRSIVTACAVLPTVPAIYVKLTEMLERDQASGAQIAAVLARDTAMAAKLLHVVNSSFFALERPIGRIEQAVALLGLNRLRALVLVGDVFTQMAPLDMGPTLQRFADHGLAVAESARRIAPDARSGDEAFTAGVLHDVGRLLLASHARLAGASADVAMRLPEAEERRRFGVTHADVGAYLLALWGLPAPLVDAIAFHHQPSRSAYPGLTPTIWVHIAESLVSELEDQSGQSRTAVAVGAGASPSADGLEKDCLEKLGVWPRLADWKAVTAEICRRAQDCSAPPAQTTGRTV